MMLLCWVTNVKSADHGMQITLQTGRIVTLSKSHESYDYFVKLINHGIMRKRPVGLLISKDNKILEVKRADQDIVRKIIVKNKETFSIYFLGHDGIFSLACNHPRFNEIYTILKKSNINSQPIWFIAQLPYLNLIDVELIK